MQLHGVYTHIHPRMYMYVYVYCSTHTHTHARAFPNTHAHTLMTTHLLIYSQLLVYTHSSSEAVPPDVYRQKPMCMSQFNMYSKCRIPCPEVDRVRHTPIADSRHITVIRNDHVSSPFIQRSVCFLLSIIIDNT